MRNWAGLRVFGRRFLVFTGLLVWALGFSAERPNIVLIFTDDQGMNDVGCYGSEIATPNIDSLARDGIKFAQWYVASSICTPSRFGLLTGKISHPFKGRAIECPNVPE